MSLDLPNDPHEQITLEYDGEEPIDVDVSEFAAVRVELIGAGSDSNVNADGESGGRIVATADIADYGTLRCWVASAGTASAAGWGRFDGGGTSADNAVAGAGATVVSALSELDEESNTGIEDSIAIADGAGGAPTSLSGGGGGARGGNGGEGDPEQDPVTPGFNAEGDGFGGDGGDFNGSPEPGGQELGALGEEILEEETGGGNGPGADADAEIVLELFELRLEDLEAEATSTSATLSWTLPVEGDQVEVYRARSDWDYGNYLGRQNAELPGDAEGHTDNNVAPDRGYYYWVEVALGDSTASRGVSAVTDGVGLKQHSAGARDLHVEIDHPSGNTITPPILDDVVLQPTLLGQPQARIPAPTDDIYRSEALEDAPVRVWKDGQQRAIERIEDVTGEPGNDELVAVGATALEKDVTVDVADRQVHSLVADIIDEHTDLVADVDAPVVEIDEDVPVAEIDDALEFEQLLGLDPFPETSPLYLDEAGRIDAHPSCPIIEAEGYDDAHSAVSVVSSADYSGGEAARVGAMSDLFPSVSAYYTANVPYVIEEPGLWIRVDVDGGDHPAIGAHIDGGASTLISEGQLNEGGLYETQIDLEGPLEPGEIDVEIEWATSDETNDGANVDCYAIYDTRYSFDFTDEPADGGVLPSPQRYADGLEVETEVIPQFQHAVSGRLEVDTPDPDGVAKLELSNDNGQTWVEAVDTAVLEDEFPDPSPYLKARLTLGRYDGDGGSTPATGDEFQAIDWLQIMADFDPTPLVLNRLLEGDLGEDVLVPLAEDSGAVWEVRQEGDDQVFIWTWPGQRDDVRVEGISDYSVTKHNRRILKCKVRGTNAPVSGETIKVGEVGEPHSLAEEDVTRGKETVRGPDGDRLRAGLDYELNGADGEITFFEDGAVESGDTVEIDYEYTISGTYEHEEYDGDVREATTERIPAASSERAAQQAAKVIVDEASEPRWEADVTLPATEVEDIRLTDTLDLDGLPGEPEVVYDVDEEAGQILLRLGNRSTVSETVQRIQSQLSSASDLV